MIVPYGITLNPFTDFVLAFPDPFSFGGQFCCSPAGSTNPTFIGQANPRIDSTATITEIVSNTAGFTSDNDGSIFQDVGAASLNAPLTITFTATADAGTGTLTEDFDVVLYPDHCCTMAPLNPVTAAQIIVNQGPPIPGNCIAIPFFPGFSFVDLAGNSILQGQLNALSTQPQVATPTQFFTNLGCDDTLTLTDVTVTNPTVAGFPVPPLTCSLTASNLVNAQLFGPSLGPQPGLTCTIAGTAQSCNGMTTPFSIALNYVCSN